MPRAVSLFVRGQRRQPSTIYRSSKLGILSLFSDCTPVFSSLCLSLNKHVKQIPDRKAPRSFTKGKRIRTQTFQITMYSIIYQIDIKPIAERDILRLDNIVAGEMASISYVSENTEKGREYDIKCLIEHFFQKVCSHSPQRTFLHTTEASRCGERRTLTISKH